VVESPQPDRAPPLFSTAGLRARDRFAAWQDHVARLNSAVPIGEPPAGFVASSEAWQLGPFLLTRNLTPTMKLVRGGQLRRRDGLDHWSVRVAGEGVARVRAADRHFVIPARQPTLSSFALGFGSKYEAGEWVTLIIPRQFAPVLSAAMARRGGGGGGRPARAADRAAARHGGGADRLGAA